MPPRLKISSPRRSLQTAAHTSTRLAKREGTISDIFTTLTPGQAPVSLPPRFADLKKELWRDSFIKSWEDILAELKVATEEIVRRGNEVCMT
jgi:hypothetical protein